MRSRLARFAPSRASGPAPLDPVLRSLRTNHPKADVAPVLKAYEIAERAHEGQVRRSGDPYITHPLAVAGILADLGMDVPTLAAALLHDTVEDTQISLPAIERDFGELVAVIVDGVTKLDKVKTGGAADAEAAAARAAQSETIRKMVIAMARDPRVLVVKLADRLHNMRTLRFLPVHKQEKKARETLELFAPLAHRLGMNTIKWELEDLAFATLYPKRYEEIVRLVSERQPSRDTYLAAVSDQVAAQLRDAKIRATVNGRPKHYYSIYQKMIVRGRDFTDIYDLVGIRILVETVRDCYATLGTIHANWQPVPGRFKDYIAMPKFNMYQSLHTTVIGPEGKPVELQIRTTDMHHRAEYGIAAHWKYKEREGRSSVSTDRPRPGAPGGRGEQMEWLRQILDWQKETADPGEFLDSLRFDLQANEVFVFTPKGDVVSLPTGATPVDFAYAVHTEVGHRCIGAKVNGRLVPLESTLDNGDTIEIFTSKSPTAGPSRDWLMFVTSSRARTKIRQWFAKERREDAIEEGREAIVRAMRKSSLPIQRLLSGEQLPTIATELRYPDLAALYAGVGEGHLSAQAVVQRLVQALGGPEGAAEDIAETALPTRRKPRATGDPGVVVAGASDVWIKLARCCTPMPGDQILGFVTRGNGVSVHRKDCVNAIALQNAESGRVVEVEWAPTTASVFLVAIQVEALDRTRLLSDVTRVLSDQHVNILSASVTTTRDRVAVSRFTFEMGEVKHLGHVLNAVRNIEGVYDVYRVMSNSS
ncbi:MAG TPA: bifunctional (p)ppGpp synthetase/guanosine-3',5'-bis(diphosphate) 3'-pyrophosphohydrolase [Frankiaceae bacterium]|nr:bifunctional (p)ppGpp synthetase/guanosine-3',5'-bis(diphosphate) 3'-pyrophosphohydrolase [Frankiaceae bacterium]